VIEIVKPNGNGYHIFVPKDWIGQPIEVITSDENLIKYPKKIGTGAHIYLSKKLKDNKVKIKKCNIKKAVLDKVYPYMHFLKGVYLVGSWARGEQRVGSDIDIMVFTDDCSSMDFNKEGQIIFYAMNDLEKPNKEDLPFIANLLNDAVPIFNENLLFEVRRKFFKKLKNGKFKLNKEALRISKDSIHTLKIMKIFFEGYDKADDKEKYVRGFKYPLEARTMEEQADQDNLYILMPHLFKAIKELSNIYFYINNKKFSVKNMSLFFKDIKNFDDYYNIYKKGEYKVYETISINDLRKIYLKCLKIKKEISNIRRKFNGQS